MMVAFGLLFGLLVYPAESKLDLKPGWVKVRELKSTHAVQAAAIDDENIYAVSSTTIAKHDRRTGKLLAACTHPKLQHLNSAFVWKGHVYCAHSNFPKTPEESSIQRFDPKADSITEFKRFTDPPGSIVWVLHDATHWWICFAHYGKENSKTVLVKYTEDFREVGRWTFPKVVVNDWDGMSASGGIRDGDTFLTTHHHFSVLYRVRVPKQGTELEFVEALTSPFPGQGIARDNQSDQLIGINRSTRSVIVAEKESRR